MSAAPGLRVVHHDGALLVLDKPAGLLSVPGRGEALQDCASERARRDFPDALVVHRLDMATSGLLLMARGTAAQRALNAAFAARAVDKRYAAVVHGRMPPAAGHPQDWQEIDAPITVDWPRRPLRIVDTACGKPSRTRWRVFGPGPAAGSMRLELEPVTGRSHQLRVHLAHIGHPILGDALYAPPGVRAQSGRLLLHATSLAFAHPVSGETLRFESTAPF